MFVIGTSVYYRPISKLFIDIKTTNKTKTTQKTTNKTKTTQKITNKTKTAQKNKQTK
jgi:hypothetical protein